MYLKDAANRAVNLLQNELDGHRGVVAIDSNGNFGKAFNTDFMIWASIKDDVLEGGLEIN